MFHTRRDLLILAALCALGTAARAQAPGDAFLPGSRVWVTGASNILGFTCLATRIDARLALPTPEAFDLVEHGGAAPRTVHAVASFTVPVTGLDCGIRQRTAHLRQTMGVRAHPTIGFDLVSVRLGPGKAAGLDDGIEGTPARFDGWLTIGGITRQVSVDAVVSRTDDGGILISGVHGVRLTDHGLVPPRRFGGLLRVRDHVLVHFAVVLAPNALLAVR